MKQCTLITTIFTFLLAAGRFTAAAQDTSRRAMHDSLFSSFKFTYDSLLKLPSLVTVFQAAPSFYLDQKPEPADRKLYRRYRHLIYRLPTAKTHKTFFRLACSLWELNKLKGAEAMFLKILQSRRWYYANPQHFASDVPGDKGNIYGYGSFTYNYKNDACLYLAKICLKRQQYPQALNYVNMAVKKHRTIYTCGTGYNIQKQEYDFMYARCYAGLGQYRNLLNLLMPNCLERLDTFLFTAIQKLYTPQQIQQQLAKAAEELEYIPDNEVSYMYSTRYSGDKESHDTTYYYSGKATVRFFGHILQVPEPMNPEKNQRLTRPHFLQRFQESDFYTGLMVRVKPEPAMAE